MKIKNYLMPTNIDEAYKILQKENSVVIGGGAFLHLGDRKIDTAIDISKLNLDFIKEENNNIEIGAAVTLRQIENNDILKNNFSGILPKTASIIMGVQIRNMATLGGTLGGKYGFSDIITSLLSLNTDVVLYKNGTVKLEEYLNNKFVKDIVVKVVIKKEDRQAYYYNIRNNSTDFSILNAAVSFCDNKYRICVGARPGIAKVVYEAQKFINNSKVNEENAIKAGEIAAESLEFKDNIKASAEYRKELCKVFVKRGILEVIQ